MKPGGDQAETAGGSGDRIAPVDDHHRAGEPRAALLGGDSAREDYPAAHSMDSSWFVVDEEGAVAVFESGEAGGVPIADNVLPWRGELGYWDGLELMLWQTQRDRARWTDAIEAARASRQRALERELFTPKPSKPRSWLHRFVGYVMSGGKSATAVSSNTFREPRLLEVFLQPTGEEQRAALLERLEGEVQRLEGGWLHLPSIESKVLLRLHDDGLLEEAQILEEELTTESLEELGFYVYYDATYDLGEDQSDQKAPYRRGSVPVHPILLTDLPSQFREGFARTTRLPLRFAQVEQLDLTRHVLCTSWSYDAFGPSDHDDS